MSNLSLPAVVRCPPSLDPFPMLLCDLFTPIASIDTRYNNFLDSLHNKWPFNVVVQLNSFDDPGKSPLIGDHIGWLPVADLSSLFGVIKIVTTCGLLFFLVFGLVVWLTPQVKI
jgi:hypothetical protein